MLEIYWRRSLGDPVWMCEVDGVDVPVDNEGMAVWIERVTVTNHGSSRSLRTGPQYWRSVDGYPSGDAPFPVPMSDQRALSSTSGSGFRHALETMLQKYGQDGNPLVVTFCLPEAPAPNRETDIPQELLDRMQHQETELAEQRDIVVDLADSLRQVRYSVKYPTHVSTRSETYRNLEPILRHTDIAREYTLLTPIDPDLRETLSAVLGVQYSLERLFQVAFWPALGPLLPPWLRVLDIRYSIDILGYEGTHRWPDLGFFGVEEVLDGEHFLNLASLADLKRKALVATNEPNPKAVSMPETPEIELEEERSRHQADPRGQVCDYGLRLMGLHTGRQVLVVPLISPFDFCLYRFSRVQVGTRDAVPGTNVVVEESPTYRLPDELDLLIRVLTQPLATLGYQFPRMDALRHPLTVNLHSNGGVLGRGGSSVGFRCNAETEYIGETSEWVLKVLHVPGDITEEARILQLLQTKEVPHVCRLVTSLNTALIISPCAHSVRTRGQWQLHHCIQLFEAIDKMFLAGVFHRDIRPPNVGLTWVRRRRRQRVRLRTEALLFDFSSAIMVGDTVDSLLRGRPRLFSGTDRYASPRVMEHLSLRPGQVYVHTVSDELCSWVRTCKALVDPTTQDRLDRVLRGAVYTVLERFWKRELAQEPWSSLEVAALRGSRRDIRIILEGLDTI
ncbi:hypothetical protein KIPB_010323 [Kipferlia bialata]|uniref:Protein kinase domain-containing protein n=1 Tax=Kipferlia bialata TaxID=797122 RepID=A0A391NPF9_9EUKA|nr:hypothetical protein KIPB_004022 [Kipferlia bialata]GCA62962.1 hypothetical protein KIPB_006985 [Kipferlia bialata]GCA63038.1 hypothetical protein KIPB_007465 [Kipferlia bialata]GCA63501.1 hypothetical protein KIPB_010323 [Kipferlia bialata]|eukprot:g4022.t1